MQCVCAADVLVVVEEARVPQVMEAARVVVEEAAVGPVELVQPVRRVPATIIIEYHVHTISFKDTRADTITCAPCEENDIHFDTWTQSMTFFSVSHTHVATHACTQ